MRRPDGAPLLLFNGRDGEWRATLEGRGKKAAVARLGERTREQIAEPDVWLCFAPVKRARIDYIAEKATELGAAVLQPVLDASHQRRARERRAAARQCDRSGGADRTAQRARGARAGGARPPARRLAGRAAAADVRRDGRRSADRRGAVRPRCGARAAPWAIVVGPEGGFAAAELAALRRIKDVTAVGLGPRILRADTAALAALACWQALVGDWRQPTPRLAADYRTSRAPV